MQSDTKSYQYGGGFLVRCPRSRGGDALAGLLAGASGGVSTSPLVVTSSCSPDGAPPSVGVCTSGTSSVSGSDGIRLGGGGRASIDKSGRSSLSSLLPAG